MSVSMISERTFSVRNVKARDKDTCGVETTHGISELGEPRRIDYSDHETRELQRLEVSRWK